MPIDKLVLIIFCVLVAAAATIWVTGLVMAALNVPWGWLGFVPTALVAYVVYRVIAERVGNAEEDHYDRMDH